MGVRDEVKKHIDIPHKEMLKNKFEEIDSTIKAAEKVLDLESDVKSFKYFIDLFTAELKKSQKGVLYEYETNKHYELIGMVKAFNKVVYWEEYFENRIKMLKKEQALITQELEHGSIDSDLPEN